MHVTSRQFLKTSQVPLIVSQLDSNMTQCDLGTSLLFCHTHNYIYHIYGKKEFLTLDTSCKFSPNRFLYDLITLSWAIRNEKEEEKNVMEEDEFLSMSSQRSRRHRPHPLYCPSHARTQHDGVKHTVQ